MSPFRANRWPVLGLFVRFVSGHSGLMSAPKFHPLSAAYLPNFFDDKGNRLGAGSKCPTCNRTQTFTVHHSDGRRVQFAGATCGHNFELATPPK